MKDSESISRVDLPKRNFFSFDRVVFNMGEPFIPSLKQVAEAAEKLPIPDLWPEDSYLIPIANSHTKQDLNFKKLAFRNLENELCYHWVYDGKVTVETTTP